MQQSQVEPSRVIVLGAGIAGLTAAHDLSKSGANVTVIDHYRHIGGNHISKEIGPYTFDIGSFMFWPDYPFFRMFPEALEQCATLSNACERLVPDRSVRRYPFEIGELSALGYGRLFASAGSWARAKLRTGAPQHLEDFCERALGKRLYSELGLKHYVERFYGMPGTHIDPIFAENRMQVVIRAARVGSLSRTVLAPVMARLRGTSSTHKPSIGRVRPPGGFAVMYEPARSALRSRGVKFELDQQLLEIVRTDSTFRVTTSAGVFSADRLINTMPIPILWRALNMRSEPRLRSNNLMSLFVSFRGIRGFKAPVLFNFAPDGRWKRLTMHSDAYGERDGRSYFSVEVPQQANSPMEADGAYAGFRAHVQSCGLFRGDLRLEGATVTDHAYPVYVVGSLQELERAKRALKEQGIETVGRQGLFDYLPTSARVSEQVRRELGTAQARE